MRVAFISDPLAGSVAGDEVGAVSNGLAALGPAESPDAAFLLDVLEHIPADGEVSSPTKQASLRRSAFCRAAGAEVLLELQRRDGPSRPPLCEAGFARLAGAAGLRLLRASYMFFLSPLLWLGPVETPDLANMDQKEIFAFAERTHRVPAAAVNALLKLIFNPETPLELWLPFPWGMSSLGVFQKPSWRMSQLGILLNRLSLLSQELEYIFQTMTIGQIAGDQSYSKNATRCSNGPWEFRRRS